MPKAISYSGGAKQARIAQRPALTQERRKAGQRRQRERDEAFDADVQELIKDQLSRISALATKHHHSEAFVRRAVMGKSNKSTRKASAKNGWLSERMKEVNAGKWHYPLSLYNVSL